MNFYQDIITFQDNHSAVKVHRLYEDNHYGEVSEQ